jgi:hypothetical protein
MNPPEREEKNKMAKGKPRKSEEVTKKSRPLKVTKKEEANMEEKPIYPAQFYKVKEEKIVIDRTPALEAVKGKQIAGWMIEDDEMIKEINLGTEEEPKMVRVGKDIEEKYEKKLIQLLKSYKDAFSWTYEDMKGIPPHICQHKIEIEPDAKPLKQSRYRICISGRKIRVAITNSYSTEEERKNKSMRELSQIKCGNKVGSVSVTLHRINLGDSSRT